jgi:hypothetical protein
MSIDNDGEGGILVLMSLLGIKKHKRPAVVAIGLFGAALIYGKPRSPPQRAQPNTFHIVVECFQRSSVGRHCVVGRGSP